MRSLAGQEGGVVRAVRSPPGRRGRRQGSPPLAGKSAASAGVRKRGPARRALLPAVRDVRGSEKVAPAYL